MNTDLSLLTNNVAQMSILQMNHLYNFKLYVDQISTFHLRHLNNYKLFIDNENLKKENNLYINEISSLKRKLNEFQNSSCCENNNNKNNKNNQENIESKYKAIFYKISPFSYSIEKINSIIASIKSLDDIIKLDKIWFPIRHNLILQRLYYLIPALIKLNNMVGLKEIKNDVFKKIIYYIQNPFDDEYLHTIISGPPGVGKTEFAKIYADIFVRLNILKSDKFIEIKRDDLVGEYLGQTSPKTRQLLESALNGVLFLDEAYSLGNAEKRDSFSKEAIDMINLYLSEKKGEFMFIIAGYEEEIELCLFEYNKGMRRRFHSHYKIDGYKPNELREIFIRKINNSKFKLNESNEKLDNFFNNNKHNFPYYGGDIEKLVNEIKQVQSLRTFNKNIKNKDIIMEDIEMANLNLSQKKERSDSRMSMYI
jgi:AAA+ superfamily predicted ATPase